ncbi:hypothetical protein [Roseateles terrae]|uniref:DUF3757 domain-containing protein n=1 Tax=Roseateles terrae TaxID=431060 RepID=A0ABR6GLB4_9BURK|nr:hypothetical protein [Roseateles terrae]MBB3192847.1 hypothetical protein [Roseateles terrae]
MKRLPLRFFLTTICCFSAISPFTSAVARPLNGWGEMIEKVRTAVGQRRLATLPESLGVEGLWDCRGAGCEFTSNHSDNAPKGRGEISLRLTMDKEKRILGRAGLTIDNKSEECYTIRQLESDLVTKFTFLIPQPVAHCVPNFVCETQLTTYRGMLPDADEGYEVFARAAQDRNCLKQLTIDGRSN